MGPFRDGVEAARAPEMRCAARAAALGAAAWLALVACAPLPKDEGVGLETLALYNLVRPSGSWPVPAGFDAAEAAFERGNAAYARSAYGEAAEDFMEAAAALRLPPGEPYAEAFKRNRVCAYTNAGWCWAMSGTLDQARRRLREAAAADPACASELEKMLTQLPKLYHAEPSRSDR